MTTDQQYRQLAAELGICDDRAESMLLDLLKSKDEALELEKVKVSAREDVLQNQLMEARVR